jgi:homogentisate 1,2-dioxygenase
MATESRHRTGSKAMKVLAAQVKFEYLSGFGNHHESEAEKGALPEGQNSPQKVPYGLFAEQLSGSSFMSPRHENRNSWLYRIRPSVLHSAFVPFKHDLLKGRPFVSLAEPNQMRWDPLARPNGAQDFVDGLVTVCGNGDTGGVRGCAVHLYAATKSMDDRFVYNADGEFLIVPEQSGLKIGTEFGIIVAIPGEIVVIPAGVKFQVEILEAFARGYVLENYGPPLRLPDLGLIGSNGLASARDFLSPVAHYLEKTGDFELIAKFQNALWKAELKHSPLDVVAWHGNFVPYKYDLSRFQAINSVSFDHPDPSIFTVLHSPSEIAGVANVDFVIFPPRWSVAEHTFRPPYFHRNLMSEYMGLIFGSYEGKQEGFVPGGASLHNRMCAHGPDTATYQRAVQAELTPQRLDSTLAFMFESSLVFQPTEHALSGPHRQQDYLECWQGLKPHFKKNSS